MTHSCVWHDSFICVTWPIHMRDMTHSCVWHDSSICVTWLIFMRDMTHSYVWHDSYICVTWLMFMRDMTHSCVCHDSFVSVTWHIHMRDMTCSYVWNDSFICVTWLIRMCALTYSYVRHDSFTRKTWLICVCATTHSCHTIIQMCDMTHSYVCHDSRAYLYSPRISRALYLGIAKKNRGVRAGPRQVPDLPGHGLRNVATAWYPPPLGLERNGDTTHLYVCRDSSHVCYDSLCVPWLMYTYISWLMYTCAISRTWKDAISWNCAFTLKRLTMISSNLGPNPLSLNHSL